MKKIYKARFGSRISNSDAEIIGRRIELLSPIGQITAEKFLKDAKRKNSPTHGYFEWDNNRAAQEYRLEQARLLIRSVDIIVISDGKEFETRAFHHIKINEDETAYVSTNVIFSNKDYYFQVLENAISEIKSWQEQYRNYRELSKIFEAVDLTITKLKRKKRKQVRKT